MENISRRLCVIIAFVMVATALFPVLTPPAGAKVLGRANLNETEPNWPITSANEMFASDHMRGKLNWSDGDDIFKINATAGKILNITLYLVDYNPAIPWDYNLNWALETPAPEYIIIWRMAQPWQTARMEVASIYVYQTGFHYLWLWINGTTATHSKETRYVLSVDEKDPTPVGPGTYVGNIDTTTGSYNDAWYKLTEPAGQGVRIELTVPATGDYDLYLYTTMPHTLKYFPGTPCPYMLNGSYVNKTGTTEVVEGLTMEGNYLVKVFGWSGKGQFSLKVSDASFFDDGDSTPATAVPITSKKADRVTMANLYQSFAPIDWYKIHLNTGEYVSANLALMSGVGKVEVLFGFTDKWLVTQLWNYTTTTGGPWDPPTGSTSITFAPNPKPGAPPPGDDYYFYVRTVWRDQTGNGDKWTPADAAYKITWSLPNYGPYIKSGAIPPITMDEDKTYSALNLNDYVGDHEDDALSYASSFGVAQPNLTVTINQTSSKVSIKPALYFSNGGKPISINFTVTDPTATWGVKSVRMPTNITIKHANHSPLVQAAIQNITINEDKTNVTNPSNVNMIFNDPDGDKLVFRMIGSNHVAASISASGLITLGPVNKWFGQEVLTAQAEDPSGKKANSTFTVTVAHMNHPPTGKGGIKKAYHNMSENSEDKTLNVTTMFDDLDISYANDSLTYRIEYPLGYVESPYLQASIDAVTRIMTLKPKNNWSGDVEIPVFAYDKNGSKVMVLLEVSVNNVNQPPYIIEVSPNTMTVTILEFKSQRFEVVRFADSDAGQDHTYRWYLNGKQLQVITTSAYMNLDTDYTNKSGKPDAGNYTLKVVLNDGQYDSTFTWNVVITNVVRNPTGLAIAEPIAGKKIKTGEKVTLRAGPATSPDGYTITYTWKDDTTGTVIGTGASFIYSTEKTGDHRITLTATDGHGGTDSKSMTISVSKPAATGLSMMMILAIVGIIVVVIIIVLVVVLMRRKKSRPAETPKDIADNYEAQMWGKSGGGASMPRAPPPRQAPRPAAPPPEEPPMEDYGASAAPEPAGEYEAPVPTWSPGGAKTEEPTEAPEPSIPKASATKIQPGPPRPGPP